MEIINLASFDFDESKIYEKLDSLSQQIEDLNVQREKEKKTLSELSKEYNSISKQMEVLTKTGRGQGSEYDSLVKKQDDLTRSMVRQRQEITDISTQTRELTTESKQLNSVLDVQDKATRILSDSYKVESQNINQLREDRKVLINLRNQEVAVMGEQSAKAKQLNKLIEETTNQEKKLVAETEQRFYQIGDYAGQLQGHFDGLKDAILQIGSGDVVGGINSLKGSVSGLGTSLMAVVATPIGAVITALVGFAIVAKYIYDYNVEMEKATKLTQEFTGLVGGELEDVTVRAKSFSEQTGADLKEVVRSVNAVAKAYNISYGQAFDMVQKGYVKAGQSAEDFFDNTDEYVMQFKNAGYSAEEFFSILESGAKSGTYKDKIVDTIKEMDLRLKEFTKSSSDALTNAFGTEFTSKLSKGLASGTITTKQALKQISDEADRVGLNFQQKQELVAGVFGAMGEDAGGFVKVLDSVQDGLNNTNRELTEIEEANNRVIDATNEYDQAFADLFNTTGGGFETMKANFKVIIFEFLTKAIRGVISLANGFIETYNNSLLLRAIVNSIGLAFSNQAIVITTALKNVWSGLKAIGNLASAIFTGDFKSIGTIIAKGFSDSKAIIIKGAKDVASNVADAYNSTISSRLKPIDETDFTDSVGSSNDLGTSTSKSKTPPKSSKIKTQKEKKDEAKTDLEDALKMNEDYVKKLADLYYKYGQDELSNQIKNNADKIKNAKVLTDEMLKIERDRLAEENRLRQIQINNEKLENDRKAEAENTKALADIEKLKVDEQMKATLKLNADNFLKQQLKTNQQTYDQQSLDNRVLFETKNDELTNTFKTNRDAIDQQRRDFDFTQKMLGLENNFAHESEFRLAELDRQYAEEKASLDKMLSDGIISEIEYNNASLELSRDKANKEKQIEDIIAREKLNIISNSLGAVSDLLGKNTIAGKAFGLAQAMINTWTGVTEVWKTPSSLLEPYATIAKVGSTATVLASGLNAIKQIKKVDTSGKNTSGGSISAGGGVTTNTYKSDYAGGSMQGLTGLSQVSGLTQQTTFADNQNTELIKNAVKEGAKQGASEGSYNGSQQGMKDLSTDRQILNEAKY